MTSDMARAESGAAAVVMAAAGLQEDPTLPELVDYEAQLGPRPEIRHQV